MGMWGETTYFSSLFLSLMNYEYQEMPVFPIFI